MRLYLENLPEPIDVNYQNELFLEYQKTKDLNIRNKIVEHNLRLVIMRINKRFYYLKFDPEDIFMTGVIGLIQAVDTYIISNNAFSSYAVKCIDNQILLNKRMHDRHNLEDNLSLDANINDTDDLKLIDLISSKENTEEEAITKAMLGECLNFLDEKEKDIIVSYFGAFNTKRLTQKELGVKYNVSDRRIQQIINNALLKMSRYKKINFGTIYDIFYQYDKDKIYQSLKHLSKSELYRLRDINLIELSEIGKEKTLYLKIKSYL